MRDVPSSPLTDPAASSRTAEERAAHELIERLRAATLGVYDVHSELGRGGMATVYLAHEISLDRKVAIKVMSPSMVHGPGMVERFKREARTAAQLSHPNIIPIYAVHETDDGLLFCVMKLVEGTPLDAVMRELRQLPVPMVQGILAQVGGALGYAHRHGVIHRDIKPANILIDDEGWAVVTDFGIAKVTDNNGLTSTGMAIGTPTYMSPEQATADVVTGASDQYSLGVVAYEMLTGRAPFVGSSMMAVMYSHFHDEPPSIKLLRPDVPDELCDAVMRMLRKDPATRWPTMEDAVAAAGARPFTHDDPSRDQLIALAKTGLTHRIVAQAWTPRSPVPRATRAGPIAKVTRNPMLLTVASLGLVGLGFVAAKMATDSRPSGTSAGPEAASPPSVVAESVTAPVTPPPPASRPETAQTKSIPAPPSNQRRVENPPAARSTAPAAGVSAPQDSSRGGVSQRAESSGTTVVQKAETTRSLPPIAPPPVTTGAPINQSAPVTRPAPNPSDEVTAVIQAYARALGASDMATARRLYPGMPNEQREGLEVMWRDGGRMTPNWSITNIAIDGDVATARVQGSNVVTTNRGATSTVPVSLRARLERRGGDWRLVALVN
jgi:serine/threonine protein kinase